VLSNSAGAAAQWVGNQVIGWWRRSGSGVSLLPQVRRFEQQAEPVVGGRSASLPLYVASPMFDERYLRGIELFNAGEFFACHDELEEVWTETIGPERDFYQGLIHVAVSLFHFEGGNLGGARKMYESGQKYLASYGDEYMGVRLRDLLESHAHAFRDLLGHHTSYPRGIELAPAAIPRIEWSADATSGSPD